MDHFMERAVNLAAENVRDGGQPFGAVLVKGSDVIAEGVNELHKTYDVSGHAEMLAIRRAQQNLQTNDLSGTTLYASGEPCPMCLAAMYFAGIERIYYCASLQEAVEAGLGKSKLVYDDLKKPNTARSLPVVQMPLEEYQENPLELWKGRNQ